MKRFLLVALAFGSVAPALAAPAPQFKLALPGYKFSFPRDHASHPEFATEWWYYTGHLRSRDGRRFGYQLTWFRQGLVPQLKGRTSKWAMRDIMFAHFALTDENNNRFHFSDRIQRAAGGVAGAETLTPHVWIGDWQLRFRGSKQTMAARGVSQHGTTYALNLEQTPVKPIVIHGQRGVSQKAAGKGHASHYYSYTRLQTRGTLRIGNESIPITGFSWLDREFGTSQMAKGQVGWDWFAIQLADGREVMLYRMRLSNGGSDPHSSGTLVEKNGRTRALKRSDFSLQVVSRWKSPHTKANYPSTWRVRVPSAKLDVLVVPTVRDQELRTDRSTGIAYWEGSNRVLNARTQREIGRAYVEMTGYDRPFSNTF